MIAGGGHKKNLLKKVAVSSTCCSMLQHAASTCNNEILLRDNVWGWWQYMQQRFSNWNNFVARITSPLLHASIDTTSLWYHDSRAFVESVSLENLLIFRKQSRFGGHVGGNQNYQTKEANEILLLKFHQHGRRDVTWKGNNLYTIYRQCLWLCKTFSLFTILN